MTSRVRTIFWKELRETMRDKRVILGVFVSPLLVTPLLFVAMGFLLHQRMSSEREEVLSVGIVGETALPGLAPAIAAEDKMTATPVASRAAGEEAVRDGRLRAVLVVPPEATVEFAAGRSATVEILFDSANDRSRNAQGRLRRLVDKFSDDELGRRLSSRGLDRAMLKPVSIADRNIASERKQGGFILGSILPYIVVLVAAFGGATSAFDACAGEKERGTLETLLVSPASRREIILGKLGTIIVVSILAATCAMAGVVIAMQGGFKAAAFLGDQKLSISYPAAGAMVLLLVPMVMMTSAMLLVVSAYARNLKEAQALSFPFMMIVVLPGMSANILGAESGLALAWVPILNTGLAMKQVLTGALQWPFLFVTLASSLVCAALAMAVAVAMFEREKILFRT